jgi:hypothetical protein
MSGGISRTKEGMKGVGALARNLTGEDVGRRGFLGALAGLSAAAAAVVGAGAASPAAAQESPEEMTKARYQESEHVLTYYDVNRY